MYVTTTPTGDPAEAEAFRDRFGLTHLARDGRPLHEILTQLNGAPLLVLARLRADLYFGEGRSMRASAGMAFLRVLRAEKGETDPLVAAAQLQRGDSVLDATLGLGGDALVAAHATQAPVLGLESSGLLGAFTAASLTRLPRHGKAPGSRVQVLKADHREFLKQAPDNSYDVVLLDPMFRRAGDAGPLFELVRTHAEHAPLDSKTLHDARRVARRGVLVKDGAPGHDLHRLGLTPQLTRKTAAICFGWAPAL